jgi:hypothetical protein
MIISPSLLIFPTFLEFFRTFFEFSVTFQAPCLGRELLTAATTTDWNKLMKIETLSVSANVGLFISCDVCPKGSGTVSFSICLSEAVAERVS